MGKQYMVCGKTGHVFSGARQELDNYMDQIGGVFYHFDYEPTADDVTNSVHDYWKRG